MQIERLTEGIRVARVDLGDYSEEKKSGGDITGRALNTPEASG